MIYPIHINTNMEAAIKVNSNMDRVELESINVIGTYSLKAGAITDDECSLCRQNLLAPSAEDLQKGNLRTAVSLGVCNHPFHKTCIDAHSAKDNYSCPICKTPWNLAKTITETISSNRLN